MPDKKPMRLVFAGPNGSGKSTITPIRIIRKHKDELSVFPNTLWSNEKIIKLLRNET